MTDTNAARDFGAFFTAHSPEVLAYAMRRASSAEAEDAVADTFLIAWRRFDVVPVGDEALLWLYGTCRRVLANQRRGRERRRRLLDTLRRFPFQAAEPERREGGPAMEALASLRPDDQELLRLVAWEELSHAEIARVLAVTTNAVAIRLHRARGRFAEAFKERVDANRLKESPASRTSDGVEGTPGGPLGRERST